MSQKFEKPDIQLTKKKINSEAFGIPPYFKYYCEYHKIAFPDEQSYNDHMALYHPGEPKDVFGDLKPFKENPIRDEYPPDEREKIDAVIDRIDVINKELDRLDNTLAKDLEDINISYSPKDFTALYEAHHCPICGNPNASNVCKYEDFERAEANSTAAQFANVPYDSDPSISTEDRLKSNDKWLANILSKMLILIVKQILQWVMNLLAKVFWFLKKSDKKDLNDTMDSFSKKNLIGGSNIDDALAGYPRQTVTLASIGSDLGCIYHGRAFSETARMLLEERQPKLYIKYEIQKTIREKKTVMGEIVRVLDSQISANYITASGVEYAEISNPATITSKSLIAEYQALNKKTKDDLTTADKKRLKELRKLIPEYKKKEAFEENSAARAKLRRELEEEAEAERLKAQYGNLDNIQDQNRKGFTAGAMDIALGSTEKFIRNVDAIIDSWFNNEDLLCCFIYNILIFIRADNLLESSARTADVQKASKSLQTMRGVLEMMYHFKMIDWNASLRSEVNIIIKILNDTVYLILNALVDLLTSNIRKDVDNWLQQAKAFRRSNGEVVTPRRCPPFDSLFLDAYPKFIEDLLKKLNLYLKGFWDGIDEIDKKNRKKVEMSQSLLELLGWMSALDKMISFLDFWAECADSDSGITEDTIKNAVLSGTNPFVSSTFLHNTPKNTTIAKSLETIKAEQLNNLAEAFRDNIEANSKIARAAKLIAVNFMGVSPESAEAAFEESEGDCFCKDGFRPQEIDRMFKDFNIN